MFDTCHPFRSSINWYISTVIIATRVYTFRKNLEIFLEDTGIKQLISLVKSYYLDSYEIYLIRNLHSTQKPKANFWQLKDHLIIYYQFIAVFELEPYITSLQDDEVVGHRLLEYESDFLSKTYYKLYGNIPLINLETLFTSEKSDDNCISR